MNKKSIYRYLALDVLVTVALAIVSMAISQITVYSTLENIQDGSSVPTAGGGILPTILTLLQLGWALFMVWVIFKSRRLPHFKRFSTMAGIVRVVSVLGLLSNLFSLGLLGGIGVGNISEMQRDLTQIGEGATVEVQGILPMLMGTVAVAFILGIALWIIQYLSYKSLYDATEATALEVSARLNDFDRVSLDRALEKIRKVTKWVVIYLPVLGVALTIIGIGIIASQLSQVGSGTVEVLPGSFVAVIFLLLFYVLAALGFGIYFLVKYYGFCDLSDHILGPWLTEEGLAERREGILSRESTPSFEEIQKKDRENFDSLDEE